MSSFVVSARKYRPAKFDDVVGQEHVVQTLKNAIQKDKLAHAFLFCGPRGVGKTSCARILAKTINCQNSRDAGESCGECDNCKTFAEQQTFNIIELDAASYNSVDHIRALNDQVRFQPQQGEYKVFIIDEVHMLSQSAFNAFLKTLEEPPPYAVFILATTEKHKILPTILSRCQIFDFKRIPSAQIVNHLLHIAKQEKIEVEDDALHIIAQKSDGALRDALSIFDRLISFTDGELTYQGTINNLNVLDYDYYFKIVDGFLLEDFAEVFVLFDSIIKNGFEPDNFLSGLAEHLRLLLVCKDKRTVSLLEVSESLKQRYFDQAVSVPLSLLLTALQIANDCDIHYPRAKNKRMHVEMALLKMNHIHKVQQKSIPVLSEKKTPVESDSNQDHAVDVFNLEPEISDDVDQSNDSTDLAPNEINISTNHDRSENEVANVESVIVEKTSAIKIEKAEKITQEESPQNLNQAAQQTTQNESESQELEQNAENIVSSSESIESSKVSIPKLTSLQKIQSAILQDDSKKVEKVDFNLETIQAIWNEYSSKVGSKSLKKVLNDVELLVEGKKVTAIVGTQFAKGVIVQESSLIENLRFKTKRNDIQLVINVDPSRAPEDLLATRKVTTNKEKYELICETNPLIKDLIESFSLKVDHSI